MNTPKSIALGEVAEYIRGINFKPEDVAPLGTAGTVACMRTKNVQQELDVADVWAVPTEFVRREEQFLQLGDILVSSANSWNLVGKCSWIPKLPWRASFGGFVSVVRANPALVEPRYLYRWFRWERTQATLRSFGRQTTNISNLDVGRCLAMKVPLPPLAEQRRIIAALDLADSLCVRRRTTIGELSSLAEAVFVDLFGEPHDKAHGWPESPLADVASTTSGGTPSRSVQAYFGGSIPWVKSGELRLGRVSSTSETLTELGLANSAAKVMPAGTVLVAMYGATVGAVAELAVPAATNQAICCIQLGPRLTADYLVMLLRKLTPLLLQQRVGGAQPNLSQDLIRRLVVPVPTIELQKEFARRCRRIDDLRGSCERSREALDSLFGALQANVFVGAV